MFTIVISEKGGAERRETFERSEISVGRVQGNDLMLPKGNVSKHHARLLFRDDRFIVTDLKSTNGTYVNGRKIAQATIVREGDKIYIGDFVLRVETAQGALPSDASKDSQRVETTATAQRAVRPSGYDVTASAPGSSQSPVAPAAISPSNAPAQGGAAASGPAPRSPETSAVSHYPLERDPDSESAPELRGAPVPRVPGPPRLPHAAEVRPRAMTAALLPDRAATLPPSRKPVSHIPSLRPAAASPGDRTAQRETAQQAARRLALIALIDRVADRVDFAEINRSPDIAQEVIESVDRVVREQANAMRADGEAPAAVDPERLARDAVRELVALGPLGPLLEDDEVAEIHVARADCILVTKGGQMALTEPVFTSDEALARVLVRLAQQTGEPIDRGQALVERQLPSGVRLVAVGPPASAGWALTLRKRRRIESSLDELVRAGSLSRAMALFLETCVGARANMLVVGAGNAVVATLLAALAGAATLGQRVTILQDQDEIVVANAQTTALGLAGEMGGEGMVRVAARLGGDRLVVASLAGAVAAATLDAIAEGSEGVLAGVAAPSLRHGLARVVAQFALARPGVSMDAAREVVGESFDVAVEARRAADGKLRVVRVTELVGADPKAVATRDIFVSNTEATGDAAFSVTGNIPRLAHDFAARGLRLDPAMFRKASRGAP